MLQTKDMKIFTSLLVALPLIFIIVVVSEAILARKGPKLDFSNPLPVSATLGTGEPLNYVIIGDSTAAGQGTEYKQGIAVKTAEYLALKNAVTWTNFSVSGATTGDVLTNQLDKAVNQKADVVLFSVGANDVTRLTSLRKIKKDLGAIIEKLIAGNCNIKIVLTGSPDMGSVPRFAQPLRGLAGFQTKRVNEVFRQVSEEYQLTFAPIAERTGPEFRKNQSLFAIDKYHPNEDGYKTWQPVLEEALKTAIASQPSHCQ